MRILIFPDLKAEKGFTRVHIRRLEKAKKFPRHVNIRENHVG